MKVTAISRYGRLIATHIPPSEPGESRGPQARLVAGPGQRAHVLEIEDAEAYHRRKAAAELHEIVKRRLELK
jgi:hypothetical protein